MQHPFQTNAVSAAFDAMHDVQRSGLLAIRGLIFEQAGALPVGRITESLKWGQPSYATPDTKAGTPIRLGATKSGDLAVFTHCQTTVMSDFRALAPPEMKFDGNRAVHLSPDMPIPLAEITPLIRAALTYRL
ncbi:DUF1801 domain-containing protein [Octadecabacter sp. 1_MG-2023]|uniref:DUF1801 domain-containing protein n=1 Tax=unclassified Octadecabacter TaxID=196158 RepID=UPI001C083A50|nr:MULTISPECIES: DUF1801 domain-containing protein [unclassified Octadecabacter]MBU2994530.1 DUF1801 domain-containing protein [Octadecabacter sp. B2R22]MDO6734177.1 DUF1801 domain-containing protein [Octadecabacter sp. 1_MG-2023]